MPGHEDTSPPVARPDDDREAPRMSRRSVLRSAAGAGVAGIAVTALAGTAGPALAAAARPAAPAARGRAPEATDAGPAEQVIVHVRDARSGEIDVFRGTGHTSVRDPELAARLVHASR